MILIISDVHGQFDVVNEQIEFAEGLLKKDVSSVIVLGDFGLFEANLKLFFIRNKKSFKRPLYFIEGNHEDFTAFDSLMKKYGKNFTHFSRGSVQSVEGHSFLCLGGAKYMDLMNTPMHSEITDNDINRCLKHSGNSAKIILSHDCPSAIGVPNTPGLEFYGSPGIARSEEILAHFQPFLWIFGHHHKWFVKKTENISFHGLAESWNGFGILEADGKFTTYENQVEKTHESFWKRWFGRF